MSFQYNYLLVTLAIIPLLYIYFIVLKKQRANKLKRLGDPLLVKEMLKNFVPGSFAKKFFLIVATTGLLILSLANLRKPTGVLSNGRSGTEVMFVLDVSKSMLAQDLKPDRLSRAKQLLDKLTDKLPNEKLGMIVFAGRAYLQMPLTGDHSAVKMFVGAATPESIPTQGTVIADALRMAAASFNVKEKKYKSIILLSDGEEHDEDALDAADELSSNGIIIHTVGVGTEKGAPIIDAATAGVKLDVDGNIVITKLNEQELMEIAKRGNGTYNRFDNAEAIASSITANINGMDKKKIVDENFTQYQSYFQIFAGLALILLLLEFFVKEKKSNKYAVN